MKIPSRIDESDTNFSIISTPVTAALPYNESFEGSTNNWTQELSDTLNWTKYSGQTPSGSGTGGTGPTTAKNGNYYLYTEASSNSNKTAESCYWFDLRATVSPEFSFYYHMYGTAMGTLKVEGSIDDSNWTTLFNEPGDKGNAWNSAQVDLSAYAGKYLKLRITGMTGYSWTSDMAIDQLSLDETSTTTYTLSYNSNASISGNVPSSQVKGAGISLTLADAGTMTNTGYKCTGWNSAANGSGTAYALGSSYTTEANLTLYAQWSLTAFETWTEGGLLFSGDTNNDGISNGLAWLLGAGNSSETALNLLPEGSESSGNLVMTFNCLNAANRGSAVMSIQYSKDLGVIDLWTNNSVVIPETSGTVDRVIFVITPNGNVNEVQATIPVAASSVFGRIHGNAAP
ncbi:InlB B-repeat-containing protein [Rubritalea profundi]|uniref:InlB B-repeat-containing protein n=1 Tax=Rubritalea profundi TaxID=1658618 RepID=UPI0013FD232C|nr:InlB B-repeat-containing protein [Rubritalea profundi]